MWWVVNATLRPFHPWERDPVSIVQQVVWDSEPVWTVAEILFPNGIRSPDRPTRRYSLYHLRYPGSLYLGVLRRTEVAVFWILTPCSLALCYLSFGRKYCLHNQGRPVSYFCSENKCSKFSRKRQQLPTNCTILREKTKTERDRGRLGD
jgi:hypothetical protein